MVAFSAITDRIVCFGSTPLLWFDTLLSFNTLNSLEYLVRGCWLMASSL